jgi:hypothetical protein
MKSSWAGISFSHGNKLDVFTSSIFYDELEVATGNVATCQNHFHHVATFR